MTTTCAIYIVNKKKKDSKYIIENLAQKCNVDSYQICKSNFKT